MYLKSMSKLNFLNKFEKINFILFLTFSTILAIGTFIFCSHLAEKSCTSLIQGWFNAEAIEIQQGNLYSVLTKAERTLTGSGLISAGKVYKLQNGKLGATVFAFGNEDFSERALNNLNIKGLTSRVIGLFKYQISYTPELNDKYVFVFIGSPLYMRIIGLVAVLSFLSAMFFLYRIVVFQTKNRIEVITMAARGVSEGVLPDNFVTSESPFLVKTLSDLAFEIQEKKNNEIQHAALQSNLMLAKQVSHDIRSPLSVLNILKDELKFNDLERKQLFTDAIVRINDTANDLLSKTKGETNNTGNFNRKEADLHEITPVVELIISEKRILSAGKNIQINFSSSNSGLRAFFNPSELKRVTSNLLNNAVESIDKTEGIINIDINNLSHKVQIIITDNGRGIPDEILSKIGTMGFSHGKDSSNSSGSGLGIYHARQTIESFGGKLSILSKLHEGTMVIIELNC